MLIAVVALWLLTLFACIGEAYWERDWPRETFKYFALYTVLVIGSFLAF